MSVVQTKALPIEESISKRALASPRFEMLSFYHSVAFRQPLTAVQSEYSLWARDLDAEILRTCKQLGIGFVPFESSTTGFLMEKVDASWAFDGRNIRSVFLRFTSEARKANQPIVDLVRDITIRKKARPAQAALARLLAQEPWIVPVPGATKTELLDDNL